MSSRRRIYLDNAATSWPKPEAVYAAVDQYQREIGAPLGRGVYREATEVERRIAQLRTTLSQLIEAKEPERIVLTSNCTAALNQAIVGLLRSGDHVVTTAVEHNSVLRPLRQLEDDHQIRVARVPCDSAGLVSPDDIRRALRPTTRLVSVSHASNVTGAIQPLESIAAIVKEHGARLLIDAAQTAGVLPIAFAGTADLVAASGHKGLLGPLGTGFLYVGPGLEEELRPLMCGGTGSASEQDRQPAWLPDKFEAGNLNVPGLVGLGAAVQYVLERGIATIRAHESDLTEKLLAGLEALDGLRVHGPRTAASRVGVISITLKQYDPQEVATMLDSAYRIQGRPGLHCAPLMHAALGTQTSGGTYRLSIGAFNTIEDVSAVLAGLSELMESSLTA